MDRLSKVVKASFDGRCVVCDRPIYEGDEIARDEDTANGWAHAECLEDEGVDLDRG